MGDSSLDKFLIDLSIALFQKHISQHSQRHGLKRSDLIIQPKEVINRDVICLSSLRNNGDMFLFRRLRVKPDIFIKMALILILIQIFFGKMIEGVFDAVVPIEEKRHVGRMVVVLIHLLQLFILKIDNIVWSSSGVINVRSSLEECLIDLLDQLPI